MDVRLDGRPVRPVRVDDDRAYRIRAVPHNADGSIDGELVTDRGYWVLLPGLTPGEHRLVVTAGGRRTRWALTAS